MRRSETLDDNDPIRYKEIILGLLSIGRTAQQIGKAVGISSRTIETYIYKLKKQYQVRNVTHLVATALRKKIIR